MMTIFTEYERNILKKFKNGAEIETPKESVVLNRWANVGYVSFGYDWDKMCGTARLSNSCIKYLNK